MIDLSLGSLIAYAVFLIIGVLTGMSLSRHSRTANAAFDRLRAEYDSRLAAANDEIRRLREESHK